MLKRRQQLGLAPVAGQLLLVGKEMLENGEMGKGVLSAGQSMGLVQDIPTCQELFDRIMAEAEEIINKKFAQAIT